MPKGHKTKLNEFLLIKAGNIQETKSKILDYKLYSKLYIHGSILLIYYVCLLYTASYMFHKMTKTVETNISCR